MRFIDLTGEKFGRLTAIDYVDGKWNCVCDCGNFTKVQTSALKKLSTKSCGCLRKENNGGFKHGLRNTSEYGIWRSMISRCYNENLDSYERYGGRGISVCDRWKNNVEHFYDDMGARPSEKHSIDRIDVDGNYEPSNCRWSTDSEQSRNRRIKKTNTSGVTGVRWNSETKSWRTQIGINNKKIDLGLFSDFDDAVNARKEAELKYWEKSS